LFSDLLSLYCCILYYYYINTNYSISILLCTVVDNFIIDVERDVSIQGADGDSQWVPHFAALMTYASQVGHGNVPYNAYYECDLPWIDPATNEPAKYKGNLGAWLMNQRQARKQAGDMSILLPEREALLQQLVDQGKLLWEDLVPESSSSHHLHLHSHNPLPQHQAFVSPPVATSDMSVWNLTSVGVSNKITTASVNPLLARGISKTIPRNRQIELDAYWDRHMAALLEYGQVKGHYNVPFAAIYESEAYVGSLGNWVHLQRLAKSGIGRKLNTRQEAALLKLEEAGKFSFGGGDVVDVTTAGSQDTTANATAATAPLVSTSSSSATAGTVTGAASNINIDTNELPWETHFTALLQYQIQHGHCNVPFDCVYTCILPEENGPGIRYSHALGVWLYQQRVWKSSKHNRLAAAQEFSLQKLVDEGHLLWEYTTPSSSSVPPPPPSSSTVLSSSNTSSSLAPLGGQALVATSQHGETSWHSHYAAILQYCKEHGHCNVPKGFSYECIIPDIGDDSPHGRYVGHLGSWLCYQRRLKKKDKSALLPDREGLLQQLVDEGEYTIVLYI